MFVHNQNETQFTFSKGINIPTGFETYVGVSRNFKKHSSSCLTKLNSKNKYTQKILNHFADLNVTSYNQALCLKLCYQDKLIKQCGCCDINTLSIQNSTYCVNSAEVECMNQFYSDLVPSKINGVCESTCPRQCEILEYNLDISQSN